MIGNDPGYSSSGPEWPSSSSESEAEGTPPTASTTVGSGASSSQATAEFPQLQPLPRHSPPPPPAAPPARRRRHLEPQDDFVGLCLYEAPLEDQGELVGVENQEEPVEVIFDESENRETPALEEVTAEVVLDESTEVIHEVPEGREASTEEGSTIASRVVRRRRRR
ncbi:hypothetical protein Emed_007585 [Eimeria media]